VRGLIRKLVQSLNRGPDRHIDQDRCVSLYADACGIAPVGLESPHKTGAVVCKLIDCIKLGNEVGQTRIIDGRDHMSDIDLGQVVVCLFHCWLCCRYYSY